MLPLHNGVPSSNCKAYKAGKSLQRFLDWPYKHYHALYTSVVSTIQQQIHALADSYREQQADISSASFEETPNSDFRTYHSSDPSHVGSNSGSDQGVECLLRCLTTYLDLTYVAVGMKMQSHTEYRVLSRLGRMWTPPKYWQHKTKQGTA